MTQIRMFLSKAGNNRFVVFCVLMILVGHLSSSDHLVGELSSSIDGSDPWMLDALDHAAMILGIIGIFGMLLLVVNFLRFLIKLALRKGNPDDPLAGFPFKSMLMGTVPIILIFVVSDVLILQSREQVVDLLDRFDDQSIIEVNGNVIERSQEILGELRKLAPLKPHHSHPEGRIAITITSRDSKLDLELGRDSQNSREYWVFYPNYLTTYSNEIGRIVSEKFDVFDAMPEIHE